MFKALHTIIMPVVGYNFKTAFTVHNFHFKGSIPRRAAYRGVTGEYILNISFTSYHGPIYTPWSRAAMWINCLAEVQMCWEIVGFEPGRWESTWIEWTHQYTMALPYGYRGIKQTLVNRRPNRGSVNAPYCDCIMQCLSVCSVKQTSTLKPSS